MSETFQTPDGEELLQADENPLETIPVSVHGIVRTDEMPTLPGAMRHVLLPTGLVEPMKVLQYNPRRKQTIIWVLPLTGVEIVCIARTRSEAFDFSGALLQGNGSVPIRYEIPGTGELWAKPGILTDTAGTITGFDVSPDDAILNIIEENWAR